MTRIGCATCLLVLTMLESHAAATLVDCPDTQALRLEPCAPIDSP